MPLNAAYNNSVSTFAPAKSVERNNRNGTIGSFARASLTTNKTRHRAPPASDAFEQESRQRRIERAVQGLPDHQRVPLVLFHFEDMTYKEIAAALGISVAKVRTDIHRGREALKRAMVGIV